MLNANYSTTHETRVKRHTPVGGVFVLESALGESI